MNIFNKLFGKKDIKKTDESTEIIDSSNSKYDGFDIEELPHAKRFFPRYKGMYLYWWETEQNYSLEKDITGSEYSKNKEGAIDIIDCYLELRGIGSNIIKIN
jgi:hypothetical protein